MSIDSERERRRRQRRANRRRIWRARIDDAWLRNVIPPLSGYPVDYSRIR
jgi:hypothetical protein